MGLGKLCYLCKQNTVYPSTEPGFSLRKSASQLFKFFQDPEPVKNCLSIWILTWNMHGKKFNGDISVLLGSAISAKHHIIVVSTQECERGIEKSVLFPSKEAWEMLLKDFLSNDYSLIATETMTAIHTAIFVRRDIKKDVKYIEKSTVATGIGNVVGNKGGIGIGITVKNISLLFINSHFTAHQNSIKERNLDFDRISHELTCGERKQTEPDVTNRFDYTFWAGDLNYRVNGTRKMVDSLLEKNLMEVMMANDQLINEMKNGKVFNGFNESKINFRPTYKFDAQNEGTDSQTDVYDTSSKQRIPSWTDRILFKSMRKPNAKAIQYDCMQKITISDHKPVYASFEIVLESQTLLQRAFSHKKLSN